MSEDENEWKWIDGYKNIYRIYRNGRVESVKRYRVRNNKFMKPQIDTGGYRHVGLSKDGEGKNFLIHRLIAIAFIPNPNPEKFDCVDHWNLDKLDNKIDNLRWISKSGNMRNRKSRGTSKYLGVYWAKNVGKWRAQIKIGGKSKQLGLFEDEDEAGKVYMKKYDEMMEEFEKM